MPVCQPLFQRSAGCLCQETLLLARQIPLLRCCAAWVGSESSGNGRPLYEAGTVEMYFMSSLISYVLFSLASNVTELLWAKFAM